MKALRTILAVAAVAASVLLAARLVVPRWWCNGQKGHVAGETQRESPQRAQHARELAAICQRCLERFPNDYEYALLLAANEHWLGRNAEAEASYHRALQLNQRPEAYAQLALLAIERGDVEGARRYLTSAALFHLEYAQRLGEPLQTEVQTYVKERAERLRKQQRR